MLQSEQRDISRGSALSALRSTWVAAGTAGLVVSVMLNMMLIGIWHGFTLTYLAFGVLHGVLLTVSVLT